MHITTSECQILALGAPSPYADFQSKVQKIDKYSGLPIFQVDALVVTGEADMRISEQIRIRSTAIDPDIGAGDMLDAVGLGIKAYVIDRRPGWSFHADRVDLWSKTSAK